MARSARELRTWMISALGLGLLLGLIGLGGVSSVQGLREHGVVTQARVIDVSHSQQSDSYSLQYELPTGRVVRCSTEDVLGAPRAGQRISVMYDSTDPTVNCQSADYGTGYGEAYVFLGASAAALAGAVVLLVLYLLARRPTVRRHVAV